MKTYIVGKKEAVIASLCTVAVLTLAILLPHGVRSVTAAAVERKIPIYSVETDKKQIAITFDAAWGNSDTDKLLKILEQNNAKATFFFTGEWVSKFPNDVLKINAAGHGLANHSDKHKHINTMSASELLKDMDDCNKKIFALTEKTPTLYRGPYGEYNNAAINAAASLEMFTLQWDIDSRDWQKKKSAEEMANFIIKNAKNGSVVLFHNDTVNTPEALEIVLKNLSKDGFEFVLAENMIYKKDFYIDSAGRQHKKDAS